MTRGLSTLSRDVMIYLFEFNEYGNNLHLITCCREWYKLYMKKEVRRVMVRRWRDDLISRISEVIENPLKQLSIKRGALSLEFATVIHHQLYELECEGSDFVTTMSHVGTFRVKNLIINGLQGEYDRSYRLIIEALARVADCRSLTLNFKISVSSNDTNIPYISSVRHLSVKGSGDVFRSMFAYSNTLHQLCLFRCDISDVSMLGSIPHLELEYCDEVKDLSALNDNETIVIFACRKIRDYSHCFANSRKIEVYLKYEGNYNIDLATWTKVVDLTLADWSNGEISISPKPVKICCLAGSPTDFAVSSVSQTIKRCYLEGGFISVVDFTATSNHILNELYLCDDKSFTSLEGFGLERVAMIYCQNMKSLQSLEGLGRGRNRKISISYCDQITDFSPLNHVPIVEIKNCRGFTDPLQVRNVRDLSIFTLCSISFKSNTEYLTNPYEKVHSLSFTTSWGHTTLEEFDGLEEIPQLIIHCSLLPVIARFLKEGKRLENQRIVILEVNGNYYDQLYALHHRYLHDRYDYDYDDSKSKSWVWFRKTISLNTIVP